MFITAVSLVFRRLDNTYSESETRLILHDVTSTQFVDNSDEIVILYLDVIKIATASNKTNLFFVWHYKRCRSWLPIVMRTTRYTIGTVDLPRHGITKVLITNFHFGLNH